MTIFAIGWEIRFGRQFRRYREFMSLNFCVLHCCYCFVIVYADFTHNMLLQRSLQISCVPLILCFYVYFMLLYCDGSQYIFCFYEETFSSYCYTFTQNHIHQRTPYFIEFLPEYKYVILSL